MTDLLPSAQSVKEHDYDRFIACLYCLEPKRKGLYAVLAISNELKKTQNIASEPMVAVVRLQWWLEALEEVEDYLNGVRDKKPRPHKMIQDLTEAKKETKIDINILKELVENRK